MTARRRNRWGGGREGRAGDAPVYWKPPEGMATETIPPSHTGEAAAVNDEAKKNDEVKKAVRARASRLAEILKVAWLAVKLAKEVVGLF